MEKYLYIYRDCWKQTNEAPTGWKTNGKRTNNSNNQPTSRLKHTEHTTTHRYIPHSVHMYTAQSNCEVAVYKQCMHEHLFIFFHFYSLFAPVDGTKTSVWSELMDEQTYNRNHCYTPKTCYLIMMWFCCRCVWMCVALHSTLLYFTQVATLHSIEWYALQCPAIPNHTDDGRHRIHNRYKWSAAFSIPFHAMHNTQSDSVCIIIIIITLLGMVMANAPKGYLLLYELSTYVISVKIAVCDFVCSFSHHFILILLIFVHLFYLVFFKT